MSKKSVFKSSSIASTEEELDHVLVMVAGHHL